MSRARKLWVTSQQRRELERLVQEYLRLKDRSAISKMTDRELSQLTSAIIKVQTAQGALKNLVCGHEFGTKWKWFSDFVREEFSAVGDL